MQFKELISLEGKLQFLKSFANQIDRDITEHLQLLLRKGGHYLYTSAEKEVVRSIKESLCYIAFDPSKEEEALDTDKTSKVGAQKFKLPDGNVIEVNINQPTTRPLLLKRSAPKGSALRKFSFILNLLAKNLEVFKTAFLLLF